MKKLLLLFAVILFAGCEKESVCFRCTISSYDLKTKKLLGESYEEHCDKRIEDIETEFEMVNSPGYGYIMQAVTCK